MYFMEWIHHMGITQEEFDAIQRGEHNPFGATDFEEPEEPHRGFQSDKEEDIPLFADEEGDFHAALDRDDAKEEGSRRRSSLRTPTVSAEAQVDTGHEARAKPESVDSADAPACMGHYETDDDECGECPYSKDCLQVTRGE